MPIDFANRVAEGVTAKLNFDYACNRGHSFGEHHVHGVVNEILGANVDPAKYKAISGFAHAAIQTEGRTGRKREVDFHLEPFEPEARATYAEVKWAGSSHCTSDRVLLDLCRLQLIKNSDPLSECYFFLSGATGEIEKLFRKGVLQGGTHCLLHRKGENGMSPGHGPRTKAFHLQDNPDHGTYLIALHPWLSTRLPKIPTSIYTILKGTDMSAFPKSRFQTLAWRVVSLSGK